MRFKAIDVVYKLTPIRKEFKTVPSKETKDKLRRKRKSKKWKQTVNY